MKLRTTRYFITLIALLVAGIATTNAQIYNVDGWTPYGSLTLQNLTTKSGSSNKQIEITNSAIQVKDGSNAKTEITNTGLLIQKGSQPRIDIRGHKIKVTSNPDEGTTWHGEIRVEKICDEYGANCRNVSQITTGTMPAIPTMPTTYWELSGSRLRMKTLHGLYLNDEVEINNASLKINDSDIILQNNSIIRGTDNVTIKSPDGTKSLKLSNNGIQITGDVSLTKENAKLKFSSGAWNYNFHINDNSWFVFEGGIFAAADGLTVQDTFELNSNATANLWGSSNIYGTTKFNTKPTFNNGLTALVNDVSTFWVSDYNGQRQVVANGDINSLRGNTEVKNGYFKVTGENTSASFYNIRRKYQDSTNPKVLSSIRLVPAGTGQGWAMINNNNGSLMYNEQQEENIKDLNNLNEYTPCNSTREGTIMYIRQLDNDNYWSNLDMYGKFIGCTCKYDISEGTFDCKRRIISSSDTTNNRNHIP